VATPRFARLDEYLESLDAVKGATLEAVLTFITTEFAGATVKLAWNVPQVQIDGAYVFGVSAAKNHLTLAPWSADVLAAFAHRLEGYVVNKGTFQIPVDWTVDESLVRDMIRARLAELAR
jgi:uncharacterized protein YdhG (YjbR/CyaY superfamily)